MNHSPDEARQNEGAGPAHGVTTVRLQTVDDAGQDGDESNGEGEVARPVDRRRGPCTVVVKFVVRPEGSQQADRHRDEEDEMPLDWCQDATDHESHERAADGGDSVDAQG